MRDRLTICAGFLAAGLVLAACGGAAAAQMRDPARTVPRDHAAHSSLCQAVPSLTRLVVVRSNAFPQNHVLFSFPARVVVTNSAAVRKVAYALCDLPRFPPGTYSCPADFGIDYQLQFVAGETVYRSVILDATGCGPVNGLPGPQRWTATRPGFWPAFGADIGLSHSGHSTFRGTMPG